MELGLIIFLSIVFWTTSLLIVHTYAVYPFLMQFLARGKKLPVVDIEDENELPEVVALMAVHNEEVVLRATLDSIRKIDYPKEKLRVMIGSDGSTDRSHEIVREFQKECPWLELRVFGGRNGKIKVVNQLAQEAKADLKDESTAVFVLCDANVSWTPSMLRKAVRHYQREEVGLVGTSVVDVARNRDGIAVEEDSYVLRENLTKYHESLMWGTVMGAFGACYTMRANLFVEVPENLLNDDFYQTMRCLERGHKAIVDIESVCNEAVSEDIEEEFKRKRRIAIGNFQNLKAFRSLFNPINGRLDVCFAFWSHKGFRWIGPLLLFLAHVSCILLAVLSPIYLIPMGGLILTWAMAAIDCIHDRKLTGKGVKLFRFVRYFYWMNGAVVLGFISYAGGVRDSIWERTHRVDAELAH